MSTNVDQVERGHGGFQTSLGGPSRSRFTCYLSFVPCSRVDLSRSAEPENHRSICGMNKYSVQPLRSKSRTFNCGGAARSTFCREFRRSTSRSISWHYLGWCLTSTTY